MKTLAYRHRLKIERLTHPHLWVYILAMFRLVTSFLCALLLGCLPSAESVVVSAIEAADQDDSAAFFETMDAASVALLTQAVGVDHALPTDWVWMEGVPWRLLAGAIIIGRDEVTDHAVRVSLNAPSSQITELWVLRADDGPLPSWRIHLPGSKGLFSPLRVVNR